MIIVSDGPFQKDKDPMIVSASWRIKSSNAYRTLIGVKIVPRNEIGTSARGKVYTTLESKRNIKSLQSELRDQDIIG